VALAALKRVDESMLRDVAQRVAQAVRSRGCAERRATVDELVGVLGRDSEEEGA
jgi:hypothetical protein